MARTVEQIVQEQVGAMFIQTAIAVAHAEALVEKVAALEAELAHVKGEAQDKSA